MTTLLVIAETEPFSEETKRTKTYRKAAELITKGGRLRIVSLETVRAMVARGEASW